MKMSMLRPLVVGAVVLAAIHAAPARAFQSQSWVASNGDDAYPCSRTQPCRTLNAAMSRTVAGGEISVVDSAVYGQTTITKPITINGEGNLASVVGYSGAAINITANATDRVIIRNLSLNGAAGGETGINITGGHVTIDKCFIYGFTAGSNSAGINVAATTAVNVDVRDTNITNASHGFLASAQSGASVLGSLDNVRINNVGGFGIGAQSSLVTLTVRNSFLRSIGSAAIATSGGPATINVDRSVLANSSIAVSATGPGSRIRLNDNAIHDNPTGLVTSNGATIVSAINNKGANPDGVTPTAGVGSF